VCEEERFFWVGMMGGCAGCGIRRERGGEWGGRWGRKGWRSEMVKEGLEGG